MVYPQVIAAFLALFSAIGLPGNLLVIVTIVLETRFHVMRFVLLASLAVSDFLVLTLINPFRLASIANEQWLFGETMCSVDTFFNRYFYLNTLLHLIAISYDRYHAIVKSPLTYDGAVTRTRMAFIALIWIITVPLAITLFLDSAKYVYNPEVFFCEQGFTVKGNAIAGYFVITFGVAFAGITVLTRSVYKTAKMQINAMNSQMGSLKDSEDKQQDMTRRITERKTTVDAIIVIGAFFLCLLPFWVVSFFRRYIKNIRVPGEVQLVTNCTFIANSVCNPIIYSIRKRGFRKGVKNVLRRIGFCKVRKTRVANNMIGMSNFTVGQVMSTRMPEPQYMKQFSSLKVEYFRGAWN